MQSKIKIILIVFLLAHFSISADDNLNTFIKQQDNADLNALKEQRVVRQRVYSTSENKVFHLEGLPEEKNCFIIDAIVLKNGFLKDEVNEAIVDEVIGRCLGSDGIMKVATAIQDFYINKGFITTRISLPSQNVKSGTLVLDVEAGRIDKVIIERKNFNEWMFPFRSEDVLNVRDLEQGLENIQQVPNASENIRIEPAEKKGYSNIIIDVDRKKNWSVKAGYSNWGNKETGRYLMSIVGYFHNVTGFSDLFYLVGTRSTTGNYENASLYYSLPVGYWSYSVMYSNSTSRQVIPLDSTALDYVGKSDIWVAKASRTLYRDKTRILAGSAELIHRKSGYKINGQELVLQKRNMDNLKFGANYSQRLENAYWNSSLSWQRFITCLGADKTPDMLYGDVSTLSQVYNFESTYSRYFTNTIFSSTFFAQFAPGNLTLQDQMTLGDRWNVRGFENSTGLNSNSGYYLQNTLYYPLGIIDASFYSGIDIGQVKKDTEYGRELLLGSAIGLQGSVGSMVWDSSLSIPLKYPRDMDINKVNFNFNLSYKL